MLTWNHSPHTKERVLCQRLGTRLRVACFLPAHSMGIVGPPAQAKSFSFLATHAQVKWLRSRAPVGLGVQVEVLLSR